jgi:hypothetical protein
MRPVLVLFGILFCTISHGQTIRRTLSGYVRENGSGELLPGVTVYVPHLKAGTTTNRYGFYSITLPRTDTLVVTFSSVGFRTQVYSLAGQSELNVSLEAAGQDLNEVVVTAGASPGVSETVQMSSVSVPIQQVREIPALLGEKDVLKVLQLLPGVQKGSEGNSGLYIRGGGPDQNLIILDDAPVYNTFHLFGFFSLFNGDALKSVELVKGGFPARYGGRLSSVIEMQMKEGNKEGFHGEGGVGIISSRLVLEGPLAGKKSSFIISGRRTYADLLIRPFLPKENKGGYYFYDLNAKLNYDFGRKNKLYLSGYFGQDRFSFSSEIGQGKQSGGLNWGNATGSLRWNHLFSGKLFANTSAIFSHYKFGVNANSFQTFNATTTEYRLLYQSAIRDFSLRTDFDWMPSPNHTLKAGAALTYHRFTPSAVTVENTLISQALSRSNPIDSYEGGVYAEDTWHPFPALRVNAGVRLSYFLTDGKQYSRPEPRLAASYSLPRRWAVKGSFATMNQYIHLLSSSGIGLPTDLWVPTTNRIAPQQSRQVALGVAKDYRTFSVTLEGFYKKMDGILAYREGSSFLLNTGTIEATAENRSNDRSWEEQITTGQGWSYGAEWLLQKKVGRFSGWIGYTLSWIQNQFDELNGGKKFWARYDRRHDLSVVGIYHLSPKITLSGTWVYGTGQALTLPQASYTVAGPSPTGIDALFKGRVYDYQERNSFRAAPYHRLDLSVQLHKKFRRYERTWEFSLYNAYSRKNPFFYYFDDSENTEAGINRKLKKLSLFPIIPSVSWSFKF